MSNLGINGDPSVFRCTAMSRGKSCRRCRQASALSSNDEGESVDPLSAGSRHTANLVRTRRD